jgi:hypothetical protein
MPAIPQVSQPQSVGGVGQVREDEGADCLVSTCLSPAGGVDCYLSWSFSNVLFAGRNNTLRRLGGSTGLRRREMGKQNETTPGPS